MTEREIFGALTRFIGVIATTYGVYTLIYEAVGAVIPELPHKVPPPMGLIFGGIELGIGLVLLLGGGVIASLVYRREKPR